jgi:hypothetical protein
MNAEYLATWIDLAKVDKYEHENKQVFVATNVNEQLILTCHRVEYPHGLHPHVILVWIKDGTSELLYQDILDDKFGQMKHSTGNLTGEYTARENIETVWVALVKKTADYSISSNANAIPFTPEQIVHVEFKQ